MSELSITNADELDVMSGDATVVVIMDDEVDVITTMEQGPPGPPGPPGPASIVAGPPGATGPAGPRGNSVLYGAVDPASGTGVNGDFYINTTTHFMFGPKTSGLWGAGYSIIGPAGPQGPTGPQGPIGLQGPVGPRGTDGTNGNTVLYGAANPTAQGVDGDFYINTTTSFIFGPKAGGAWPGGTSLVGPQGPRGDQGVQGVQGPKGDTGNTGPQGPSGTATVLVSDAPPAGAADGTLWFESDTGLLYARYNDGTSTQWVIVTPQPDLTGYLPLAGGVITGPVSFAGMEGTGPTGRGFTIDGPAATTRAFAGMTSGSMRWRMTMGNAAAETGGNAGSDFYLQRYDDSGANIDAPLIINRATGQAIIKVADGSFGPMLSGSASVHRGIFGATNNVSRWQLILGNGGAGETGSNAGSDFYLQRYNDAGALINNPMYITRSTGVTTFAAAIVNGPSDARLKENVEPITGALAKVVALQGVRFNMIETPDKREIGLIAQDVAPLVPEVLQTFQTVDVEGKSTGEYFALDYPKLTALLIEAVKELTARVQELENA